MGEKNKSENVLGRKGLSTKRIQDESPTAKMLRCRVSVNQITLQARAAESLKLLI